MDKDELKNIHSTECWITFKIINIVLNDLIATVTDIAVRVLWKSY